MIQFHIQQQRWKKTVICIEKWRKRTSDAFGLCVYVSELSQVQLSWWKAIYVSNEIKLHIYVHISCTISKLQNNRCGCVYDRSSEHSMLIFSLDIEKDSFYFWCKGTNIKKHIYIYKFRAEWSIKSIRKCLFIMTFWSVFVCITCVYLKGKHEWKFEEEKKKSTNFFFSLDNVPCVCLHIIYPLNGARSRTFDATFLGLHIVQSGRKLRVGWE